MKADSLHVHQGEQKQHAILQTTDVVVRVLESRLVLSQTLMPTQISPGVTYQWVKSTEIST